MHGQKDANISYDRETPSQEVPDGFDNEEALDG